MQAPVMLDSLSNNFVFGDKAPTGCPVAVSCYLSYIVAKRSRFLERSHLLLALHNLHIEFPSQSRSSQDRHINEHPLIRGRCHRRIPQQAMEMRFPPLDYCESFGVQ